MPTPERLAEQFEEHRSHVRAVAYRMLGSVSEAEDAVQEAWIRLSRTDVSGVDNLRGWLTTVVGRVCLDMLRTRASRRGSRGGRDPRRLRWSRAACRAREAGAGGAARVRAARCLRHDLRRDRAH